MIHRLLELEGRTVAVSEPDRRLCNDVGPTKLEIMTYYMKVAPRMMPFLQGRPTSTVFRPDESTQEFRFARTAPPGCPGRFATYRVASFGTPRLERYLTVPDASTLEALVDYGCLSFHPWSSTAAAPFQPNQMVFNLDPEAIAFREVRNAALLLRNLLGACGLKAWVKTSGGRGLHVLVPLRGSVSFADTRLAADTIVRRAIRREPSLFSRDPRRARRRGRILIDTSRNERGATLIAPYSVATSGIVSALLEWHELERPTYPEDFDVERVVARERADLDNQAGFFAAEQSLVRLLRRRRSRWSRVDGRACAPPRAEWLVGDTPAAVADEAHWLSEQSRRIRDEVEVTRIENSNIRSRAEKVREVTARCYHHGVPAKVPWLPSAVPPGARPERCPKCGRMALIPWTLRRDNHTKAVLRTWVCTECQQMEERPEPE
jgi:bifunctional non-homologous end joining protein LigD